LGINVKYADRFCEVVEKYEPEHTYTFVGTCLGTRKQYSVTVKGPDLHKYRQGAFIKAAFPYISKGDREFLISGYSPEGWNQTFGGSDEDEDDEDELE